MSFQLNSDYIALLDHLVPALRRLQAMLIFWIWYFLYYEQTMRSDGDENFVNAFLRN